jgi:hypothetical protein
MRYQIFRLQQEALVNLDLNTEEALLLDWLLNWKDGESMERIVVGDDLAYWVNYSTVVSELPILFNKPKSNSTEDIEKAKKANTAKVARMLKGSLSKVLTRHEKKVQGKTKIYISFDRTMLDILLNYESKKDLPAPTDKPNTNQNQNINVNNSIPQKQDNDTRKSKKNNFGNNYQNKPKNKNGIKCVNDTFKNYGADELEKKLLQSQKGKFEDRIKIPIAKEKEDITEDYWNIN